MVAKIGKLRQQKFSNSAMQAYTDEQLIEVYKNATGSRRKKAFDCLYLRYSKPITNYFYFALQNDSEKAKDFFHDLFLKILESPEKFDTKKQFKPWIYKVAGNMCKNDYRTYGVVSSFGEHVKKTTGVFSELTSPFKDISESIKMLTPEQRSLIVLRFKINLSIKEMAEIYECPEGTIKSRLFYATKELSNHYKTIAL
jgi:RNA polymerase sigma-70 factor (ECF subfamily)